MKTLIVSLCLFSNILFGQLDINKEVIRLTHTELEKETIKSAFLQVYSESKDINIRFAESTVHSENTLNANNPFYTASITKMFTATEF